MPSSTLLPFLFLKVSNDIEGSHNKSSFLTDRHRESFWMEQLSFVTKGVEISLIVTEEAV